MNPMEDIALIPLSRGLHAIVDAADFEKFNQYKWFAGPAPSNLYARRNVVISGKKTAELLHRAITGATSFQQVDHINGNPLDNRRQNLRLCSSSENSMNRRLACLNTSGYKGVSKHTKVDKWQAAIGLKRKKIYLGLFDTKEQAAMAYDMASILYFGQYAKFNLLLFMQKGRNHETASA